MNHHDKLTERERIRIHAQTKHEQLKAEAIDILIDAIHRQTRGGATVSFDHNLALKIEKLIIGNMRRAKIIALVRTGIHEPYIPKRQNKAAAVARKGATSTRFKIADGKARLRKRALTHDHREKRKGGACRNRDAACQSKGVHGPPPGVFNTRLGPLIQAHQVLALSLCGAGQPSPRSSVDLDSTCFN